MNEIKSESHNITCSLSYNKHVKMSSFESSFGFIALQGYEGHFLPDQVIHTVFLAFFST